MPSTYKKKTDREYQSHKMSILDEQFKVGFLAGLDGRSKVKKELETRWEAVIGCLEKDNEIVRGLAARFVFLWTICEALECKMLSDPELLDKLFGRWTQAINTLSGLARTLGVDPLMEGRKIKQVKKVFERAKAGIESGKDTIDLEQYKKEFEELVG